MSANLAELLGTMILVLLGDGVVANVVLKQTKGNNAGWIVITAGWGFAVAVAAWGQWLRGSTQIGDYGPAQIAALVVEDSGPGLPPEALARLATLRDPVDAFFEAVMINAEDAGVRKNRYAMLARLRGLFVNIADISTLS